MTKETYSEKLKHPKWQQKRLKILSRDNFSCTVCSDKETELHVHHKAYNKNPWDAHDEDLDTLCKHCHNFAEYCKKIKISPLKTQKRKQKDGKYNVYLVQLSSLDGELFVSIFNHKIKSNSFTEINMGFTEVFIDAMKGVVNYGR